MFDDPFIKLDLRSAKCKEQFDLDKAGFGKTNPTDEKRISYIRGYCWRRYGIRIKSPIDVMILYMMQDHNKSERLVTNDPIPRKSVAMSETCRVCGTERMNGARVGRRILSYHPNVEPCSDCKEWKKTVTETAESGVQE